MPLQFDLVQAPMSFGLAEGVDPHQVPFGTLVTAENLCWLRSGRVEKRPGTVTLPLTVAAPTGGTLSAAKRLGVRGTELYLIDGAHLYAYSANLASWVDKGRLPEGGLDWETTVDAVRGIQTADSITLANGQLVEAWVVGDPTAPGPGGLYFQIRDPSQKPSTIVAGPIEVNASTVHPYIRLVASGSTWFLIFSTTAGVVAYATYSGGSLATNPLQNATDAVTTGQFCPLDACVIGTTFVVAYAVAGGNLRLRSYAFATPGTQVASANITTSSFLTSVSVGGAASESLYVGWCDGSANTIVFGRSDPSTLVASVAPTTVETGSSISDGTVALARETSTTCNFLYSFSGTGLAAGVTKQCSISSTGTITRWGVNYFMRALSRPFLVGTRFYAAVCPNIGAGTFATAETFLADVTSGYTSSAFREVGKVDVQIGGRWAVGYVTSPSSLPTASGVAYFAFPYAATPSITNIGVRQGLRAVRFLTGSSAPPDMWRSIQVGPESYIAGGVMAGYDGLECIGFGWPHGPYIDTLSPQTTGGVMAAGAYIYNVTAERRSVAGIFHRSPTGIATSITTIGATGSVVVGIRPCSFGRGTASPASVGQYPIYRSVVGGSIVQRAAVEPTADCIQDISITYPATVTDIYADAALANGQKLATRAALYSQGGELEDNQPPSALTVAFAQSRIWIVDGSGRTVWVSKDSSVNGDVAPGFHPNVTMAFDRALTAIAPMDDKVIAFASDRLWAVLGQGPAPDGSGNTYQITAIQSDVGCFNPRSVVSFPDGIIFQSVRGIFILGRDLSVGWLGRPVRKQLFNYPNITSAVLVPNRSEVRFTCNSADGLSGIVLVYNYVEKQWSTFRHTVGGVYGPPIVDAVLWNGVWTFCTAAGVVVTETTASYLDGSTWVPMTLETAWVSAAGPLAFQSVRAFALEGESLTDHDLTIQIGFNNSATYLQSHTFTAGGPVTAVGPLESAELSVNAYRKCQNLRFKLSDAAPTGSLPVGTGRGLSLDMLGIEVGMKKGFVTKPQGNTG